MKKKEENQLLFLTLAVGYIRLCLMRAKRATLVDCATFAKAHLAHPDFEGLTPPLRGFVEARIAELIEGGGALVNDGQDLVAAVACGQYEECWVMARRALRSRGTGRYAPKRKDIRPDWLA